MQLGGKEIKLLKNPQRNARGVIAAVWLLAGSVGFGAGAAHSGGASAADAAFGDKVIHYIREKFPVPDNVKLTIEEFQPFTYPDFEQALMTVDDGKQKRTQPVYVTKDHRYLIMGPLFLLGADPKAEIVQHIRELYKVPEATSLAVGPFQTSPFPNLYAFTLKAVNAGKEQTQNLHITKDSRCLVVGNILDLAVDPRRHALQTIATANHPSQGPAHAPVTIVEYADLECPTCARLHEFLEKEVLPKYGDKVRVVFKEFPLPMHDWSLTAAIANECVYQNHREAFVPFRSLIFQNQGAFNVANVRDMLLALADQVGADRVQLAGCLDAKASLPRIEQDKQEAKRLDVQSTPTCFINGRIIVGSPPPDVFYQVVDDALRGGG